MFDVLDDNDLISAVEEIEAGTLDAPATAPDDTFAAEQEVAGTPSR